MRLSVKYANKDITVKLVLMFSVQNVQCQMIIQLQPMEQYIKPIVLEVSNIVTKLCKTIGYRRLMGNGDYLRLTFHPLIANGD